MNVRIYLEASKNVSGRIIFGVTLPTGRFWIKTKVYEDYGKFNVKTQKFSDKRLHEAIHAWRNYLVNLETEAIKERVPLTREWVKSKYDSMRGVPEEKEEEVEVMSFLKYFDHLKEKYKNIQGAGTIKNYTQVKRQLMIFNPNIGFDDLNETFYYDYTDFLITEANNRNTGELGLSMNTIGKHWDKIRKVCREARNDGLEIDSAFESYKSPSYRIKPVWLTKEEASAIVKLELSGYLGIVRDEFLCRYYTSLRTSDMDLINKESFMTQKGQVYLNFVQVKTKKQIAVPLNPMAVELFERYEYRFPHIAQQVKNRYIKEICQEAEIKEKVSRVHYRGSQRIEKTYEKWELVSTHTARRSYGRRFMESGGSMNQLREIMGHTDTKTTALYVGWEYNELSDSVNRIEF